MRNRPVLDGKIENKNDFCKNMILDWEDAKLLHENWDLVSREFLKSDGDLRRINLPKEILNFLSY